MNLESHTRSNIKSNKNRLVYLDNLKVFLIILVIVHHVGQAYGPTGGFWPYQSSLHESVPWLGRFFRVNAAFFMGLLFMISGYFFPVSFDRKGDWLFLRDKLVRYGIPLLFAGVIMVPLIAYFYHVNYSSNFSLGYWEYFTRIWFGIGGKPEGFSSPIGFPEFSFAHLWFVEHLLVYAVLYCIFRTVFKNFTLKTTNNKAPRFAMILIMGTLIAATTFIAKIWFPIDKWVKILGFIQSEVVHLPQYIALFATGIIASRKQWFQMMDKKVGFTSLALGMIMAGIVYVRPLPETAMKCIEHNWAIYDSFMAVFICWGLVVLFRELFNSSGTFMQRLAANSYAAYIVHVPMVIVVQYMFDKVVIGGALGKFIIVSITSVVLTYALSVVIRKIPYVTKVL